ncbi:MAG TPA: hypothetical protein VFB63_19330 [Bryobacteraceae bacterium]|nr:hypothetical protein [Bryobacteraceae bacterium]
MSYIVQFDYEALQKDLGFLPGDLPPLLQGLFGEKITKAGVYAWFARERMTVERLVQLLAIVRIETDRKLNVWKYIRVTRAPTTKRAA